MVTSMETISITIRGNVHSYEIGSPAVDLALAAFRDAYPPKPIPTVDGDDGHPGTKPNPITDTEHMAKRLRIFAEEVVSGYAAKLDSEITPNTDTVRPFISGE